MKWRYFFLRNKLLIFIGVLVLYSSTIIAQDSSSKYPQKKDDTLARYLSDTLNAASKITELMNSINSIKPGNANERAYAIEKYQVAFQLAPYAINSPNVLATLYARFSGMTYNAGAKDISIQYAKKGLIYLSDSKKNDIPEMEYNILARIASYYLRYPLYDSAEKYFKEAARQAYLLSDPLWKVSAENNIGTFYDKMSLCDSAMNKYLYASKMLVLKNKNDTAMLCSINDNIAENYANRQDFYNSLEFYKKNMALYYPGLGTARLIKTEAGIANCLISLHKYTEGFSCLQKAKNDYYLLHENQIELLIRMENIYMNYYEIKGDWGQALSEQRKVSYINDSVAMEKNKEACALLELLVQTEILKSRRDVELYTMQLSAEKSALQESTKKAALRLVITILITIIAAILIALLFLYYSNRTKQHQNQLKIQQYKEELTKNELEKQKLEQEKLEQELNHRKGDLHDLGIYLSKIKDLHESITVGLKKLKDKKSHEQEQGIKELLQELESQSYFPQRLELVQENIERVNREFYDKLIKLYPELTKSEIELCGLFRLNMANKEICALKGISQESVKMARYRLRKKLQLSPTDDIYKVLSSI